MSDSRAKAFGSTGRRTRQDFEFISNDPQENADNFDPKWARLRELTTDEERYKAIRERWGNSGIPDPKVNLSHVHRGGATETAEPRSKPEEKPEAKTASKKQSGGREVARRPRRSRSCTRPIEEIISNIENNYVLECSRLYHKHSLELEEMLQVQNLQVLGLYARLGQAALGFGGSLEIQQRIQMQVLLSNQYAEMKGFVDKKAENIDSCKRYMDEIRAFITFYQKMHDSEVTLQMTDEQYEHTVETEKMYGLYAKYYK